MNIGLLVGDQLVFLCRSVNFTLQHLAFDFDGTSFESSYACKVEQNIFKSSEALRKAPTSSTYLIVNALKSAL